MAGRSFVRQTTVTPRQRSSALAMRRTIKFFHPLAIRLTHWFNAVFLLAMIASGLQIFNAYPVRYFDPGTGQVAHPNAGPQVHIPQIETPPLRVAK